MCEEGKQAKQEERERERERESESVLERGQKEPYVLLNLISELLLLDQRQW